MIRVKGTVLRPAVPRQCRSMVHATAQAMSRNPVSSLVAILVLLYVITAFTGFPDPNDPSYADDTNHHQQQAPSAAGDDDDDADYYSAGEHIGIKMRRKSGNTNRDDPLIAAGGRQHQRQQAASDLSAQAGIINQQHQQHAEKLYGPQQRPGRRHSSAEKSDNDQPQSMKRIKGLMKIASNYPRHGAHRLAANAAKYDSNEKGPARSSYLLNEGSLAGKLAQVAHGPVVVKIPDAFEDLVANMINFYSPKRYERYDWSL